MQLCDVNVLVYAHRVDSTSHTACRRWLETLINGPEAYGYCELVLGGFVRVVTHPRIFSRPSSISDALAFAEQLREQPTAIAVGAGPRHWSIFRDLCTAAATRGNLVADAYLAAIAIESGCEWITTNGDFTRFQGLRTRSPLS